MSTTQKRRTTSTELPSSTTNSVLGDALREEVYGAIDRILQNPKQHRVVEHDIRRCFVHRFPYSVLFRELESDLVRVLTVRHHRQHESYGLERK